MRLFTKKTLLKSTVFPIILFIASGAIAAKEVRQKVDKEKNIQTKDITLSISSTAELSWPSTLETSIIPVSLIGGLWVEGKIEGKSFSSVISRIQPRVFANTYSVNRFWKENLELANYTDLKNTCSELSAHLYRCILEEKKDNGSDYVTALLFWHKNNDIVLIRFRAPDRSTAIALRDSFSFHPIQNQ